MRKNSAAWAPSDTAVEVSATREKEPTQEIILRVAETLFAQHGFNGASMRDIASSAGVALSQLHYYFKSKKDLYFEVFLYRGSKITSERLRMLEEARRNYPASPIPLNVLIAAFVRPYLECALADGEAYVRLYSRLHTDSDDLAREIRSRIYDATTNQFVAAFRATLPDMPEETLYWRIVFMMGTYNYALLRSGRLEAISENRCDSSDMFAAMHHLLPFLEAAMCAPWAANFSDRESAPIHYK